MKVLIFLGPGGVGKTTISAAAAIEISKKYK
jgi:anion-transporting  ArsA/GET3 family ATPase